MNNHVFTLRGLNLLVNISAIKLESLRLKIGVEHHEIATLANAQNQKGKIEPQGPRKPLS